MHWFWRAVIAAAVGYVFAVLLGGTYPGGLNNLVRVLALPMWWPGWRESPLNPHQPLAVLLFWFVPTVIVTVLTYATAGYYFKGAPRQETRCRKCDYILRGLTEPRCPECGEGI